jgi:RNA 3'-terminal phosphate cyclase (ATP)
MGLRVIDGARGEGGGQVLRTALSLSAITGVPIRVENIRAGRHKGGLLRQHLACVRAIAALSEANVRGDELGSTTLELTPRPVRGGRAYTFSIGSAGSTLLLLQTVLPTLLTAQEPTEVLLEGGTHNPLAPTYEFVERAYLPLLRRMGADVTSSLERPGFAPAGGGRVRLQVTPSTLRPLSLLTRGAHLSTTATALVSAVPGDVAQRELARVAHRLRTLTPTCHQRSVRTPMAPGNALTVELEFEHLTEVFTTLGERGLPAEVVADRTCDAARVYMESGAVVGEYLADQLLLPLALAGGGEFVSTALSSHAATQVGLVPEFLAVEVSERAAGPGLVHVVVRRADP